MYHSENRGPRENEVIGKSTFQPVLFLTSQKQLPRINLAVDNITFRYIFTKKENYLRIEKSAETVKQRKAAHNLRCANMHTNRSHYT